MTDYQFHIRHLRAEIATLTGRLAAADKTKSNDRIEALEAALRDVANTYDDSYRKGSQERRLGDLARAALAPEQDK